MTMQGEVLKEIKGWSKRGTGVTRATLSGSMGIPINRVTGRVTELLDGGLIEERGFVKIDGRKRALLHAR